MTSRISSSVRPYTAPMSVMLRFRRVMRRFLWWLRGKFQRQFTFSSRQGRFTVSTRDQGIAFPLYRRGEYDFDFSLKVLAMLREERYLPEGPGVVLDIGANIGVICIGLVLAREAANAIAIEPEPDNFALLQHNVMQNGLWDRIVCIPKAIGATTGELTMELSESNLGDHRVRVASPLTHDERFAESERKTIVVPIVTLSQAIAEAQRANPAISNPHVAWIDIQGNEGFAFRGGAECLRGIPTVGEVWPYGILRSGMQVAEFCEIVRDLWSDFWELRDGRFLRRSTNEFAEWVAALGTMGWKNVVFTGPKLN